MKRWAHRITVDRRQYLLGLATAVACAAELLPSDGWTQPTTRRVIALEIRKRKVLSVKGKTVRVNEGDDVRIDWTTDEAVDLHLHGYDIEARVAPGHDASMTFRAHTAGRFPVSAHNFGHRMLLYLEVRPR